jgi:integrase/recombinase XerD
MANNLERKGKLLTLRLSRTTRYTRKSNVCAAALWLVYDFFGLRHLNRIYDHIRDMEAAYDAKSGPTRPQTLPQNYKSHDTAQHRQCIYVGQAQSLVRSILDPEEKAIIVLFLRTGMLLGELVSLDVGDVDMDAMTIRLHPTGKRSNEIVYFDYETSRVLARWLRLRDSAKTKALFIGRNGRRLSPDAIERIVTKHAVANELHDPSSNRHQLQSRLTPHCLRHWFTTRLIEAGCPREYVKELRGDSRTDVIDIYTHIDKKKLKAIYLAKIPQLGLL